jgi:hypothetical protein
MDAVRGRRVSKKTSNIEAKETQYSGKRDLAKMDAVRGRRESSPGTKQPKDDGVAEVRKCVKKDLETDLLRSKRDLSTLAYLRYANVSSVSSDLI